MTPRHFALFLLVPFACTACGGIAETPAEAPPAASSAAMAAAADALVEHGEYMVRIGGCNDCHTPGYVERGGDVPKAEWLTGSPLGYRGPWGTTYASNLRLTIAGLDEAQWLAYSASLHTRPIMPDFMLRGMREHDRRAIHRFVRSLGAAGVPAPAALPPGSEPPPPYFDLVVAPADAPHPERQQAAAHQGRIPVQ